jgi:hypothetical protein
MMLTRWHHLNTNFSKCAPVVEWHVAVLVTVFSSYTGILSSAIEMSSAVRARTLNPYFWQQPDGRETKRKEESHGTSEEKKSYNPVCLWSPRYKMKIERDSACMWLWGPHPRLEPHLSGPHSRSVAWSLVLRPVHERSVPARDLKMSSVLRTGWRETTAAQIGIWLFCYWGCWERRCWLITEAEFLQSCYWTKFSQKLTFLKYISLNVF